MRLAWRALSYSYFYHRNFSNWIFNLHLILESISSVSEHVMSKPIRWPLYLSDPDLEVLQTRQFFMMTRTWSLLTKSIWRTVSPTGTRVSLSVKCRTIWHLRHHTLRTAHTLFQLHSRPLQPWCERKWTWKQTGTGLSTQTSARSQRQMVNQADCLVPLPLALLSDATLLPLPKNLRLGTQDRCHPANVTLILPWKLFMRSRD